MIAGHRAYAHAKHGLLAFIILWALSGARCAGQDKNAITESLSDAEAKLHDLRVRLAEKEKVVNLLKGSACKAKDDKCRQQKAILGQKLYKRQAEQQKERKANVLHERVRVEVQLDVPLGVKVAFLRFLPIQSANSSKVMNRYLIAADTKTGLHMFNSAGEHLLSYETGHAAPITAFTVDSRPTTEFKFVTGSADGEIRVHTMAAPTKPKKQLHNKHGVAAPPVVAPSEEDSEKGFWHGQLRWNPTIVLAHDFFPARSEPVRGLARRHHTLNFTDRGPRAIATVEFIPKGRSFTLVVADAIGRLSQHVRNGSFTATVQLPGATAPRCSVAIKTFCVICTETGLSFFDTKERRLLQQTCTRITPKDEGVPEPPPKQPSKPFAPRTAVNATASNETNASNASTVSGAEGNKRKKATPLTLNASIVSFMQDVATEGQAFAGTTDGKMLMLQVRAEKNRLRCTLMHEIKVTWEPVPVLVASTKGFAFAAVTAKSGSSLSVYNLTTTTRYIAPEVSLQLALQPEGAPSIDLCTDKNMGIGVVIGDAVGLIQARLDFVATQDWDMNAFSMLRHPLIIGGLGMLFIWQLKSKNKGGSSNAEDALREDWASKLGRKKGPTGGGGFGSRIRR